MGRAKMTSNNGTSLARWHRHDNKRTRIVPCHIQLAVTMMGSSPQTDADPDSNGLKD